MTIYIVTYTAPGEDHYDSQPQMEVLLVTTDLEAAAEQAGNDPYYDIQVWEDGTRGDDLKYPYLSDQAGTDADGTELATDTNTKEPWEEEWMVADIAEDGSIDGGVMFEGGNAEEEARAYHARMSSYNTPTPQQLLLRKVTPWEEVTP